MMTTTKCYKSQFKKGTFIELRDLPQDNPVLSLYYYIFYLLLIYCNIIIIATGERLY